MNRLNLSGLSRRHFLLGGSAMIALSACAGGNDASDVASAGDAAFATSEWRDITEDEWKARLSPKAFYVLRQEGTERSFTSPLNDEKRAGTFHCAGCDLPLFESNTKYDSGTGWPSFFNVIEGAIGTKVDNKLYATRTEYHCARCLGHQGHVFTDGPKPTGLRYCNNGVALSFKPA